MILRLPRDFLFGKFIIPLVYFLVLLFEKEKKQKILGYLISLWFFVPALGYSFYGGTTSEYYMLFNSVLVIYILVYLQKKLLRLRFKPTIYLLAIFWIFFLYFQTKDLWIKDDTDGLVKQKEYVRERIRQKNKIEFDEGKIESYLWHIWVEDPP